MQRQDLNLCIKIARAVYRVLVDEKLGRPGKMSVSLKREEKETGMLIYTASLPEKTAADVTKKTLSIVVVDAEGATVRDLGTTDYGPEDVESAEFGLNDGEKAVCTLTMSDDATPANVSEPRVFEFVATDTIAPAQPGEFGVTLKREE